MEETPTLTMRKAWSESRTRPGHPQTPAEQAKVRTTAANTRKPPDPKPHSIAAKQKERKKEAEQAARRAVNQASERAVQNILSQNPRGLHDVLADIRQVTHPPDEAPPKQTRPDQEPLRKVWSESARLAAAEARRAARQGSVRTSPEPGGADQPIVTTSPRASTPVPAASGPAASIRASAPVDPRAAARRAREQASRARHHQELHAHAVRTFQQRYGEEPNEGERTTIASRASLLAGPSRLTRADFDHMTSTVRSFGYDFSRNYTGRTPLNQRTTTTPTSHLTSPGSRAQATESLVSGGIHDVPTEFREEGITRPHQVQAYQQVLGTKNPDAVPGPKELTSSLTGGLPHRGNLSANGNTVQWSGSLKDEQGNNTATLTRSIRKHADGTLEVHHDYFKVADNAQAAGLAKGVLRAQMGLYQKLGVDTVTVYADIDVGKYAWAKYGFLPSKRDWATLSDRYRNTLNRSPAAAALTDAQRAVVSAVLDDPHPKALWTLADSKIPFPKGGVPGAEPSTLGKELMLMGPSWDGSIKTKDQEQTTRFENYVRPKQPI